MSGSEINLKSLQDLVHYVAKDDKSLGFVDSLQADVKGNVDLKNLDFTKKNSIE